MIKIIGGIPDKLGNRYEAKWVVRSLVDVITGKADWLKFEGLESEYKGFEFAIAYGEITEWYQTKMNAPAGNWTINALKKEGVLKAFLNRFLDDKNSHCFFVSQDNAKDFRTFTEKARCADSYKQFLETLSKKEKDPFQKLKDEWQQSDEIIFAWLKRSYILIFPERELESFVSTYSDLLFWQYGKSAFPELREILEEKFNVTLDRNTILKAIKDQGKLIFKAWAFDPSIQQRLKDETTAYLETYTPFGAGGKTIIRNQVKMLNDELQKCDGSQLIILSGVAGSGKSGVIRGTIDELKKSNIPHLAFRVDHNLSCRTKQELGEKLTNRRESPVSTLKGIFPNKSSVLFIDQVDAVSEVAGRDGQVKEVLFQMIHDAYYLKDVKIVVSCRTFDMINDPRLKKLKDDEYTKNIDIPLLNWNDDITPILKERNFNINYFNENQRQLLCLPVNFTIFLEINEPNLSFYSCSNLYEKLLEKKQRIISRERNVSWSLLNALHSMSNWMSKRQKLDAPISVLDNYSSAVDILSSEGLIVSYQGKVNFFHESCFDYVFARTFVNGEKTIIELLMDTEQHLFRRTQTRQILDFIRQDDFERYLHELSSILHSSDIRFHIKDAICKWLGSMNNPTHQEFDIILELNESDEKFSNLFVSAIFSTHVWFDLLNKKKWVKQKLNVEKNECSEMVLWWLSKIAGKRPVEIAKLLRLWWGDKIERAERLLNFLNSVRSNNEILFKLCEDIINTKPPGLFKNKNHNEVSLLLHTWEKKLPPNSDKILQALFNAWFELNPNNNPFDRENRKYFDNHSLAEVAKQAPQLFLNGVSDTLARSVDMVVADGETGRNWFNFRHRTYSGGGLEFEEFLGIYRTALKTVMQDNPETGITYLDKLNPNKHQCLMHLHLEAIQVNPVFLSKRLVTLVSNKIIFESGWNGAEWLSFANACREAFPYLESHEKEIIEQAIAQYTPEINMARYYLQKIQEDGEAQFSTVKGIIRDLNRSGYIQWCIFETIGERSLLHTVMSLFYQLRRKFSQYSIAKPNDYTVSVGRATPIKREQCAKMKNSHWLSALQKYDGKEENRYRRGIWHSGPWGLANELLEATKNEPVRFINLCLNLSDAIISIYYEYFLSGLVQANDIPEKMLIRVIEFVHKLPGNTYDNKVIDLIKHNPQIWINNNILEILICYALNGQVDTKIESEEKAIEHEVILVASLANTYGSIISGESSIRGKSWKLLGEVLEKYPNTEEQIYQTIDNALNNEGLISVRCCMLSVLISFFNINKERFSELIQRLIEPINKVKTSDDSLWLSPLISYSAVRLFPYIFRDFPELANNLISKLLKCDDNSKRLIGAWLIFGESFQDDAYADWADALAKISIEHRRLLASVTSGVLKWTEYRHRAENILKNHLFDEDEQVRINASGFLRHVDDIDKHRELILDFVKSPALLDRNSMLFHILEDTNCNILEFVIEATKRMLAKGAHNEKSNSHDIDFYNLKTLLKREYVSSELNPQGRKDILDFIDYMLEYGIYGVDDIVTPHDRW